MMNQSHFTRERLAAAHQRELEREAAHERLAASVARDEGNARPSMLVMAIMGALVALAIIGTLVAFALLGSGGHFADTMRQPVIVTLALHLNSTNG